MYTFDNDKLLYCRAIFFERKQCKWKRRHFRRTAQDRRTHTYVMIPNGHIWNAWLHYNMYIYSRMNHESSRDSLFACSQYICVEQNAFRESRHLPRQQKKIYPDCVFIGTTGNFMSLKKSATNLGDRRWYNGAFFFQSRQLVLKNSTVFKSTFYYR